MDSDSDDGLPSVGELNREVAGLRTLVAKQVSEALAIHECLRGLLRQNQLVSTACAAYFHGGTLSHLTHALFCVCVARRGGAFSQYPVALTTTLTTGSYRRTGRPLRLLFRPLGRPRRPGRLPHVATAHRKHVRTRLPHTMNGRLHERARHATRSVHTRIGSW